MGKRPIKKDALEVFRMAGTLTILSSFILVGFKAYIWLIDGYWEKIAVWKIIPSKMEAAISRMEWLGVQKILLWTFDSDLTLFLFIVGLALLLIPSIDDVFD